MYRPRRFAVALLLFVPAATAFTGCQAPTLARQVRRPSDLGAGRPGSQPISRAGDPVASQDAAQQPPNPSPGGAPERAALVSFSEGAPPAASARAPDAAGPLLPPAQNVEIVPPGEAAPVPLAAPSFHDDTYPIDLATALALGGANHLRIRLARERVFAAQVDLAQARLNWLPSLRGGVQYNKHEGRLQATEGEVVEASRNSLFLGGGAGWGQHPLTGGASGPARLFVDFSLADAAFEPLVARQVLQAQTAAVGADTNDALLAIAVAYFDLVEAYARLANARLGAEAAGQMLELATLFAREGRGAELEVERGRAEQAQWRQAVSEAQRRVRAQSAELARLLRLEPQVVLVPVEHHVAPAELIAECLPVEALLAQGLTRRPELAQQQALVAAALERLNQEKWRPFFPYLAVGISAGSFGGGPGSTFDNQGSRADADVLAVWQLNNLGLGNYALQRERDSQMRQARFDSLQVRDRVMAEIVTAWSDVGSYREQMELTGAALEAATRSFQLNLARIRQGQGLPIELLQSIRARNELLDSYTRAVLDYNRAQARLLRAIGEPLGPLPDGPTSAISRH